MEENINIPDGWHLKQVVEFASKMQSGGTPKSDNLEYYNGEIPFVAIDDLSKSNKYISKTQKKITNKGLVNSSAWLVPKYSLLYSIYATLGVPRINLIEVATNQAILNIIPNKKIISLEFLYYLLLEKRNTILSHSAHTTQSNLNAKVVKELEFVFPKSTIEQDKIAEILSKVDKAISETEIIIAKYNRIKTGLMQDLLTKGIDEQGNIRSEETHEFKDSPLGRIPKEWSVKNLGELITAIDPQPDHRTPPQVLDGIPYLGISDFTSSGDIDVINCRKVGHNVLTKQSNSFNVDEGDIIFGKIGTIGKPKKLPNFEKSPFTLSANVILIKPIECPAFVYWSLISDYINVQVSLAIHSTSQPAFGMEKIRALNIITPQPKEREVITEKLKAFENIFSEEEKKLSKLKSIKTGLMQDLLSGKKRVTHLIN
ncbi:restriction endonuclease subunit S [Flavobacterium pectinovorum]|uniref:restriction endonuclease subunit S n=1 Tax=Flavobacterium pectinovorum TaxID=29533 RepID=UPI00265E7BF6|nr:restriction endonuclease subunit S [Flavobacterium pectinovorum]WKL50455.1 restriction endonuclease subunit S [Flavobacterium pectinovorum]